MDLCFAHRIGCQQSDAWQRVQGQQDTSSPSRYESVLLGRIGVHEVVLTGLISAGTNQAGSAAIHMYETFRNLRFILMVGIGGGIPCLGTGEDVRLGDVVVSMPSGGYGGVIQYDSGKFLQNKDFQRTGALPLPPKQLRKVVNHLRTNHEGKDNCITKHIEEMLSKFPEYTKKGLITAVLIARRICSSMQSTCTKKKATHVRVVIRNS